MFGLEHHNHARESPFLHLTLMHRGRSIAPPLHEIVTRSNHTPQATNTFGSTNSRATLIVLRSELWGGHPQLAAIDIIPRANENLSAVFDRGVVP